MDPTRHPLATVRLTPCPKSWDALDPDPDSTTRRHCDQCQLQVHDTAALTEREAQRLIAERDQRLCLRILRRPDGSVVTREAPAPQPHPRWLRRFAAAASWLLICLGLAPSCDPAESTAHREPLPPTAGETPGQPRRESNETQDDAASEATLDEETQQNLMLLGYVSETLGEFAE